VATDVVPSSLIEVARGAIQIVIHKVGGQTTVINLRIVISDNNNNNHQKGTHNQAFRASTHKHAQYRGQEPH
jgi:hypothetical protein